MRFLPLMNRPIRDGRFKFENKVEKKYIFLCLRARAGLDPYVSLLILYVI